MSLHTNLSHPPTPAAPPVAPSPAPLSLRLRAATVAAHRTAEQRPFIANLMSGRLTPAAHLDLTEQYLAIYSALEQVGAGLAESKAAGIVALRLDRTASLRRDLAALGGPAHGVTGAASAYAEHLLTLRAAPAAWVGHAYTRYLGDLSGGQAIAAVLQRRYELSDAVTSFYRFDGPVPALRETLRAHIDAAPFTADEARVAETEAKRAFAFAADLFDQLADRHPARSA